MPKYKLILEYHVKSDLELQPITIEGSLDQIDTSMEELIFDKFNEDDIYYTKSILEIIQEN